tara:strand:- start:738 stop:1010 length:273 start_codon:yes stop_codon:yes gene_type:complete
MEYDIDTFMTENETGVDMSFTHADEENGEFYEADSLDIAFCVECGVRIQDVGNWLLESASTEFLECDKCINEKLEDEVNERIENLINYYT